MHSLSRENDGIDGSERGLLSDDTVFVGGGGIDQGRGARRKLGCYQLEVTS